MRSGFRTIAVLVFGIVLNVGGFASEAESLFMRANESYQNGDYESAISFYERIVESGYESWEVYFNLGNAYFKRNELGLAILNYERAYRLAPKEEDVNFNLELARLSVVDSVQEIPDFFLIIWFRKFAALFSLPFLGGITLALYLSFFTLIILWLYSKNPRLRKSYFVSIITITGFLILFSTVFGYRIIKNENRDHAIVLANRVDIKSAPNDSGVDVFTLHEGIKVEIKDRSSEWVKIRLADGKIGWLKEEAIARI